MTGETSPSLMKKAEEFSFTSEKNYYSSVPFVVVEVSLT